jgi:hypothetical protein
VASISFAGRKVTTKSRWITLFVAALLAFVTLAWLAQQPGPVRRVAIRLFGPPVVAMAEVHTGSSEGATTFDHSALGALLAAHVDADGRVDYAGLEGRREELRGYLAAVGTADPQALGRDELLALLINAYNAFTLELILEHYPVGSIRDIPEDRRWKAQRWTIGGESHSLDRIEHERIRGEFREPRIHFALVCAAEGCPPLRAEAYVGARLDAQLDDQMRRVHGDRRWIRYEPGAERIELTALYEWYAGDFEQVAPSVLDYVARYRDDLAGDLAGGHVPAVRYLEYDWSLNDARRTNRPASAR